MAIAHAPQLERTPEPVATAPQTRTALFVEASSGGVVGGSLTGLVHQMRGMGAGWRSVLVLYEPKAIEAELLGLGVRCHHVRRWRVPKEHVLQKSNAYHTVRRAGLVRNTLHLSRLLLRTVAEEFPASLALARIIRAEKADIVHLGNGVRANFDAILACWMTRTACIAHGKGFEKYGGRERWAAAHIDALVCMSSAVKAHCERSGVIAPRMPVIYDAVDVAGFRPTRPRQAVRAELGIGPGDCAAGILGGIQEWKGQAVVVEAIARIRRELPNLRCLIVGGVHRAGERYAEGLRQKVTALGLDDVVRFTGFRHDVPDVINALDVVVHASTRPEPFGRVILEGMLLGRSVIAAAAGGVVEFVEDGRTGFLVPPGDAEKMAERLATLARDPELRARLGREAQSESRERFSLAHHVEAMTHLYQSVLEERKR